MKKASLNQTSQLYHIIFSSRKEKTSNFLQNQIAYERINNQNFIIIDSNGKTMETEFRAKHSQPAMFF